jgi:hypothetical protein
VGAFFNLETISFFAQMLFNFMFSHRSILSPKWNKGNYKKRVYEIRQHKL